MVLKPLPIQVPGSRARGPSGFGILGKGRWIGLRISGSGRNEKSGFRSMSLPFSSRQQAAPRSGDEPDYAGEGITEILSLGLVHRSHGARVLVATCINHNT